MFTLTPSIADATFPDVNQKKDQNDKADGEITCLLLVISSHSATSLEPKVRMILLSLQKSAAVHQRDKT